MFVVTLKHGEILNFDGKCTDVDYADPKFTIFKNKEGKKELTLALIPTKNILFITNDE